MRFLNLLSFSVLLGFFIACTSEKETHIKVVLDEKIPLDSLSSASGIVYAGGQYYIVGDDSPWLYVVDESMNTTKWVKLSAVDTLVDGRTPKSLKADYECMESMTLHDVEYLLFLSSGSSRTTRDTAIIFDLTHSILAGKKNIRPFFEKIKSRAGISGEDEINLEGLAISESHAFMLHRGNISGNILVALERESLFNYIAGDHAMVPEFEVYKFTLPQFEGFEAGFSGACMSPDNISIVFTASVEKTNDVYHDGTIAGSYVGLIPISSLADGHFMADLLLENGQVLTKKLEGVAVKSSADNTLNLIVVTDNDDGTSDLIRVKLILSNV